ncbi:hypothetical protein GJV85_08205 [Sulfurimonas aquatica]|uniref:FecR protein domain-containing protein n=1 Tax=Sulfurimonas aquatica TaxID=2672570 RepID=A0A975B0X9_9BACT|nr:FecR family protein [Sulfurimonas aquatica]QSZ42093.1 hypothetical protein GJV85_08205 [Sulfurimonas aquatica]
MKLFLMVLFLALALNAEEVAIVKSVEGVATLKSNAKVVSLTKGAKLSSKDVIMTENDSKVVVIFNDNSSLVLGSNSIFSIDKYIFKPIEKEYAFDLSLTKGSVSFESGKIGEVAPENFQLKTPEGVVGIRGTKFLVKVKG